MGDLRENKKRATRQRLSDVATGLFFARGFDAVTIEDIAAAAKVSKMTVFNYFARKEDLFFDRQDEVTPLLRDAIGQKPKAQAPIDALRCLVDRLREQKHPFAHLDSQTFRFFRVVAASPALKSRLREIQDEAIATLAHELAAHQPDASAHLAAALLVATWRTAYSEALRISERGGSAKKANAAFMALIDGGFDAARGVAPKA